MAYVISDKCIACGKCVEEAGCPADAIEAGVDKYSINPDLCMCCGACAGVCEQEAIYEE